MEALTHMRDLEKSRAGIHKELACLSRELTARGFFCHESFVNFILIECHQDAAALCDCLERKSILVRDCTSFGLPSCIRVAVRTHDENLQLMEALNACMP